MAGYSLHIASNMYELNIGLENVTVSPPLSKRKIVTLTLLHKNKNQVCVGDICFQ